MAQFFQSDVSIFPYFPKFFNEIIEKFWFLLKYLHISLFIFFGLAVNIAPMAELFMFSTNLGISPS